MRVQVRLKVGALPAMPLLLRTHYVTGDSLSGPSTLYSLSHRALAGREGHVGVTVTHLRREIARAIAAAVVSSKA